MRERSSDRTEQHPEHDQGGQDLDHRKTAKRGMVAHVESSDACQQASSKMRSRCRRSNASAMGMLRHHRAKLARRQESTWSNHPFDFGGPTAEVARRLIGARIVRHTRAAGQKTGAVLVARIV